MGGRYQLVDHGTLKHGIVGEVDLGDVEVDMLHVEVVDSTKGDG